VPPVSSDPTRTSNVSSRPPFGEQGIYQRTQKIGQWRVYFTFALYHDLSQFNEKARESVSIRLRIISEMRRIASEQQVTLPPLDDDLSLHETSFPPTIGGFIRACENVPA